MLSGVRGSRLLDRRPPHYRCPAVPGLKTSARAILMARGPSVLSLWMNYLPNGNYVLLVLRTALAELLLRYRSRRPLITAGHPVRSSASSPSCNNSGFELHHRTVLRTAPACTAARQFVSAGPCLISATRETITTPPPNVYSGRHRFPRASQRDSRPRSQKGVRWPHSSRGHPL